MRMRLPFIAGAALTISAAGQGQAALQLFTFSGIAGVGPSGTPIAALQQFQGATVVGAFVIDTAAATLQVGGPVGGQGESARLLGAIKSGQIDIFGTNGPVSLLRTGNDPGNIFTINNGGVPSNPNNRIDQIGYSTGAGFAGGTLFKPYDLFGGNLPPDLFLGSLFFGRSLQGPFDNPPALVTDVTTRDFAGALTGPVGSPLFMALVFRQGDPSINGTLTGLPLQQVSVGSIQLSITNLGVVPEPQSWAMLIIGFGLTGAVLRRRRVVVRAA